MKSLFVSPQIILYYESGERCVGVPRCVWGCEAALPPLALQPVGRTGTLRGLEGVLEVYICRSTHHQKRPNVSVLTECMCKFISARKKKCRW